jgi:hypothetical protein
VTSRSTRIGSRSLDDQRPVQAAPDLLEAALMRVVPVGTGIGDGELVDEGRAGRDRLLGQMRHAIHGIRHAQAVPMHRGLFREPVVDRDTQALALAHADRRARHPVVVRPYRGLRMGAADQMSAPGAGHQAMGGGFGATGPGRQAGGQGDRAARGQKRASGQPDGATRTLRTHLPRLHPRNSLTLGSGGGTPRPTEA